MAPFFQPNDIRSNRFAVDIIATGLDEGRFESVPADAAR
jgi:hypothetical protein